MRQTTTHAPKEDFRDTNYSTCMFLDGGRKPEYPERTHTYMGRTCKLHTERPQTGVDPGTLLLWGNSANHHTTVHPDIIICFINKFIIYIIHYAAVSELNTFLHFQFKSIRFEGYYFHTELCWISSNIAKVELLIIIYKFAWLALF